MSDFVSFLERNPIPNLPGRMILRTEWEPDNLARATAFHRQPPVIHLGRVTRTAAHYTAAMNLPDGDTTDIAGGDEKAGVNALKQNLRNSLLDYLSNRTQGGYRRLSDGFWFPGYPNGYSLGFDVWGNCYEINGFDFLPAATSGHNSYTIAHLAFTDRFDPGTEVMWSAMRAASIHAKNMGATKLENRPWAHRQFRENTGRGTATACCGDALVAQLDQGLGDLDYKAPDRPITPITNPKPKDPIVVAPNAPEAIRFERQERYANVFAVNKSVGGAVESVTSARMKELIATGVHDDVYIIPDHEPTARSMARRAGLDPDNAEEFWPLKS